jgi:peptidoglycan hydrolase-like protein with peptidoglycan-binding domain
VEKAVKAYQKANGLTEDGIVGPELARKLDGGAAPKTDGAKVDGAATK